MKISEGSSKSAEKVMISHIEPYEYLSNAVLKCLLFRKNLKKTDDHEKNCDKITLDEQNSYINETLYNLQKLQIVDKDWSEIGVSVYKMGVGMYHSSLVVDNVEWHFWEGCGVQPIQRYYDDAQKSVVSISHVPFIQYVPVETVTISPIEIAKLCTHLGSTLYSVHTYDILKCNCNHFTSGVLQCLGLANKMPPWINRLANATGALCSLLPFVRQWVDFLLQRPGIIDRYAGLRNPNTYRQ